MNLHALLAQSPPPSRLAGNASPDAGLSIDCLCVQERLEYNTRLPAEVTMNCDTAVFKILVNSREVGRFSGRLVIRENDAIGLMLLLNVLHITQRACT